MNLKHCPASSLWGTRAIKGWQPNQGGNGSVLGRARHVFKPKCHRPRGRTLRCARCARAVRKVGCFPPLVATGPRVLNSAPYSRCWYTRDFFFSLMLATGFRTPKRDRLCSHFDPSPRWRPGEGRGYAAISVSGASPPCGPLELVPAHVWGRLVQATRLPSKMMEGMRFAFVHRIARSTPPHFVVNVMR